MDDRPTLNLPEGHHVISYHSLDVATFGPFCRSQSYRHIITHSLFHSQLRALGNREEQEFWWDKVPFVGLLPYSLFLCFSRGLTVYIKNSKEKKRKETVKQANPYIDEKTTETPRLSYLTVVPKGIQSHPTLPCRRSVLSKGIQADMIGVMSLVNSVVCLCAVARGKACLACWCGDVSGGELKNLWLVANKTFREPKKSRQRAIRSSFRNGD